MIVLSTRDKIRYQALLAMEDCDKILGHLQNIDELADKQSTYITSILPGVVELTAYFKTVLTKFRSGL